MLQLGGFWVVFVGIGAFTVLLSVFMFMFVPNHGKSSLQLFFVKSSIVVLILYITFSKLVYNRLANMFDARSVS